jgi:hypothetical protein
MCGSALILEELLLSFGLNLSSNWTFSTYNQEVNGIVYFTSGFSKKLQKMQIIRANHLHVKKEI